MRRIGGQPSTRRRAIDELDIDLLGSLEERDSDCMRS
jgi:chorismate mutase